MSYFSFHPTTFISMKFIYVQYSAVMRAMETGKQADLTWEVHIWPANILCNTHLIHFDDVTPDSEAHHLSAQMYLESGSWRQKSTTNFACIWIQFVKEMQTFEVFDIVLSAPCFSYGSSDAFKLKFPKMDYNGSLLSILNMSLSAIYSSKLNDGFCY